MNAEEVGHSLANSLVLRIAAGACSRSALRYPRRVKKFSAVFVNRYTELTALVRACDSACARSIDPRPLTPRRSDDQRSQQRIG